MPADLDEIEDVLREAELNYERHEEFFHLGFATKNFINAAGKRGMDVLIYSAMGGDAIYIRTAKLRFFLGKEGRFEMLKVTNRINRGQFMGKVCWDPGDGEVNVEVCLDVTNQPFGTDLLMKALKIVHQTVHDAIPKIDAVFGFEPTLKEEDDDNDAQEDDAQEGDDTRSTEELADAFQAMLSGAADEEE